MVMESMRFTSTNMRLARFWIPVLIAFCGALAVGSFTLAQWREARRNAELDARHDFAEIMANLQGGVTYLQRQSDLVGVQTMIANQGFDPHLRNLLLVDL